MTQLQVEVADFHKAATTIRHDVAECVRICLEGVSFSPEMVGEDPAGEAWSASYDPAARAVLRATAQLSNAAARVSLLFAHSGHNYALAEAASTSGTHQDGPDFGELLRPLPTVHAPAMPRSGGAGNGTPSGWWLIEHTIGVVWPGGHQDRLRTMASEWRTAANGIASAAFDPIFAGVIFARDRLPEADDVLTICRGMNDHLNDLVHSYRSLASACESYADHLDECHDQVRDELGDLVRDSIATQATGAVFSVFTFGGSEVAAQTAQAGRIAAAVSKVSGLIQRMIAAGRRIAEIIDRVHTLAQDINNAVQGLLDVQVVYADVTHVGKTAHARGTRQHVAQMSSEARNEAAAAGRLATGIRIKRSLNARERKHILDGDGPTSGGHRYPGNPGKELFPREWSDEQIIGNIEDIVNSDDTQWRAETGNGGTHTRQGRPARWRAWEFRDGTRIRVIWEPATGHIRSAFPDPNTPANGVLVR